MYHSGRSMCLFSRDGMTSLQREDLYIIANYGRRYLALQDRPSSISKDGCITKYILFES
jgi:hypothetical protein